MPTYLIHHQGAWNEFNTIADAPRWTQAMTLQRHRLRRMHRELGELVESAHVWGHFDSRVARALVSGCSALDGSTLDDCIAANRAGEGEARLSREEFIARFLTLPAEPSADGAGQSSIAD